MLEAPRHAPPTGMSPPPLALHSRLDLHGLGVLLSSDRDPVSLFVLYPSISRLALPGGFQALSQLDMSRLYCKGLGFRVAKRDGVGCGSLYGAVVHGCRWLRECVEQ